MISTLFLPDDLDDDAIAALLRALPVAVELCQVQRGMDMALSTEVVVEAAEGPVAMGRRVQRQLGRAVAVTAKTPYGWLLIDPVNGEWIVDYEPGDDGFVLCEPYVEPAANP